MRPWSEKYHPQKIKEIIGQNKAVEDILAAVKLWKRGDKPLLLYGQAGTGKTVSVRAIANELGYELIELNASEDRTAAFINTKALGAATQLSLLGKGKIILIDELDGIYGTVDRGAIPAISKLFDRSIYPIILTANDPYLPNLKSIRIKCRLIHFTKVNYRSVANRLLHICSKEKIKVDKELLTTLALRSGGDVRSAITDLQTVAAAKKQLLPSDLSVLAGRDKEMQIFETLKIIFKTMSISSALDASSCSDKSPDDLLLWIAQNIPLEYAGEDMAKAYDIISRADVYRGRIKRRQYYGFMSYQIQLQSAGVSLAKKEKYTKYTKYQSPDILLKMTASRTRRAIRNSITKKIADKCHLSSKKANSHILPYLRQYLNEQISGELSLTPEEVAFIK